MSCTARASIATENSAARNARPTLSVLFEFPPDIAKDPAKWRDPVNWPMVQPNLGRSVHLKDLIQSWNSDKEKGERSIREWASQYLNIEMGVGHKTDGWPGAEFWAQRRRHDHGRDADRALRGDHPRRRWRRPRRPLRADADRPREDQTKNWLTWSHAWCHRGVLERRKSIAPSLSSSTAGELTIVDNKLQDHAEIVEIIGRVNEAGLLGCVALDPEGPYGELVDALALIEGLRKRASRSSA
jgi:phage terminase large subunit-like protein